MISAFQFGNAVYSKAENLYHWTSPKNPLNYIPIVSQAVQIAKLKRYLPLKGYTGPASSATLLEQKRINLAHIPGGIVQTVALAILTTSFHSLSCGVLAFGIAFNTISSIIALGIIKSELKALSGSS